MRIGDQLVWPVVLTSVAILLTNFFVALAAGGQVWVGGLLAGLVAWFLAYQYHHSRGLPQAAAYLAAPAPEDSARIRLTLLTQAIAITVPAVTWLLAVGMHANVPAEKIGALANAAAATIVLPLQEEVFFRGVCLFGMLSIGIRPSLALCAQALLFVLAHGKVEPASAAVIFMNGLTWGVLAIRHGRIWPGMVLHILWNLCESGRALLSGAFMATTAAQVAPFAIVPPVVGAALCLVLSLASPRPVVDRWHAT